MSLDCGICDAVFSDDKSLDEHEQLHRQLDSLAVVAPIYVDSPGNCRRGSPTSPGTKKTDHREEGDSATPSDSSRTNPVNGKNDEEQNQVVNEMLNEQDSFEADQCKSPESKELLNERGSRNETHGESQTEKLISELEDPEGTVKGESKGADEDSSSTDVDSEHEKSSSEPNGIADRDDNASSSEDLSDDRNEKTGPFLQDKGKVVVEVKEFPNFTTNGTPVGDKMVLVVEMEDISNSENSTSTPPVEERSILDMEPQKEASIVDNCETEFQEDISSVADSCRSEGEEIKEPTIVSAEEQGAVEYETPDQPSLPQADRIPTSIITMEIVDLDKPENSIDESSARKSHEKKKPTFVKKNIRRNMRRKSSRISSSEESAVDSLYMNGYTCHKKSPAHLSSIIRDPAQESLVKRVLKMDPDLLTRVLAMNRGLLGRVLDMDQSLLKKLANIDEEVLTRIVSFDKTRLGKFAALSPIQLNSVLEIVGSDASKDVAEPVVLLNRVPFVSSQKLTAGYMQKLNAAQASSIKVVRKSPRSARKKTVRKSPKSKKYGNGESEARVYDRTTTNGRRSSRVLDTSDDESDTDDDDDDDDNIVLTEIRRKLRVQLSPDVSTVGSAQMSASRKRKRTNSKTQCEQATGSVKRRRVARAYREESDDESMIRVSPVRKPSARRASQRRTLVEKDDERVQTKRHRRTCSVKNYSFGDPLASMDWEAAKLPSSSSKLSKCSVRLVAVDVPLPSSNSDTGDTNDTVSEEAVNEVDEIDDDSTTIVALNVDCIDDGDDVPKTSCETETSSVDVDLVDESTPEEDAQLDDGDENLLK